MAAKFEVQTYAEKKRVYATILELVRTKEIQRVSRGVYTYSGKLNQKLPKQKIMWNYFRMRMKCGASITVEELQTAAGVSRNYASEWLGFLVRIGFAENHGNGRFQLLKDPVDMPIDEKKAEKLRNIHARKRKEVIAILDEIRRAFARLEETVGELAD